MLLAEDGRLYFMEMNTRLQVEHTISEEVTGLDLVEWQLRIAANQRLTLSQSDISVSGHSIEFRINAEDPSENFRPSPGLVTGLRFPSGEGIRVDTHLTEGERISPHYDSMVAKLIVTASNREDCIVKARSVLQSVLVDGVVTNLELLHRITTWDDFVSGNYNTGSLEQYLGVK